VPLAVARGSALIWQATTKIWRGLSKFTVWRVVGGIVIGTTVPLQTGNESIGEARGHALNLYKLKDDCPLPQAGTLKFEITHCNEAEDN
jgi:hypothetical protein